MMGYLLLLLIVIKMSQSYEERSIYNNGPDKNESSFVFPDYQHSLPRKEVPLDLILRLNEVTDVNEFIEQFTSQGLNNVTMTKISSRIFYRDFERSAITKAKMARCMPELQTVSVKPVKDSAVYYHPSCIRIERCGGCCAHSLLTCTAVDSEIINIRVVVAEYKGGTKLDFRSEEVVPVEKHTKCKCDCKIQPENCTKYQKYNKSKCKCECDNPDVEKKCYEDVQKKIWNKDRCACMCRQDLECGTGFYYDPFSCRCEPNLGRRKHEEKPWIA